jgi:hypothetical protein
MARVQDRAKSISFVPCTTQSIGMTDTQIFLFLVMPFLVVLTCSMVFFSQERSRPEKAADPPEPRTSPNTYIRKPRKKPTAAQQADMAED